MSVGAFGIEKEGLEELLKEASIGKSQLPEFQRGWVWADRNIAGLIALVIVWAGLAEIICSIRKIYFRQEDWIVTKARIEIVV